MKSLLPCCILVLTVALCSQAASQEKLITLAIGQVFPSECPLPNWFKTDPLLEITIIPTDVDLIAYFTPEEAGRYVRQYFPRTEEALSQYEFFAYPDGNLKPLTGRQIMMLADAIRLGGAAGLVTMGGDLSSPQAKYWYTWAGTPMEEIVPIKMDPFLLHPDVSSRFTIKVAIEDPPVLSMFKPLGIEDVIGTQWATLYGKEGSRVWADAEQVPPDIFSDTQWPWLISWTIGEGNFWAVADDLDHGWWSYFAGHPHDNPYAFDVFVNIMLYATGRDLPDDIQTVHKIREGFREFLDQRSVLYSIIDFVDKFGGKTRKTESMIAELNAMKGEAERKYLSQDYGDALDLLRSAGELYVEAKDEAMKAKDEALLYVYLVEWSATTGTLTASGFVVYTLMIRRKMYREIGITRDRRRS